MIESAQNKIIKYVRSLQEKKERDRNRVFVAEGLRFVSEIPENWPIEFCLVSEQFEKEEHVPNFIQSRPYYTVADKLFQSVCDTKNAQGILAVCNQRPKDWHKELENRNNHGLYILCEELNDPGNLGTIIRTAHAAAANGIFLSPGSVDLYNSKVLRATMGAIFHVPVYTDAALPAVIDELHQKGVMVYAAHLNGKSLPYEQPLWKGSAFLIGNEARGLQEKTAQRADIYIKLPMPGGAESLNASVAAGILLYEAVRQRIGQNS